MTSMEAAGTGEIEESLIALETAASEQSGTRDVAEVTSAFKRLLDSLGVDLPTFCRETEVSNATAYRWLKGESVPRPMNLRRIRAWALPTAATGQGVLEPVRFLDARAGLWSMDYFFHNAGLAKNIFVLRTEGRYLAEDDHETERKLYDLLDDHPDLLIVYACPITDPRMTIPQQSFWQLKNTFIWNDWRTQATQLQIMDLCSSTNSSASDLKFDLGQTSASTFVLEFDDEGQKRFKREAQILVAIPVQRYSSQEDADSQYRRERGPETVFVEIPDRVSNNLWREWSPNLKNTANELRDKVRIEREKFGLDPASTSGTGTATNE